jgi:hypothetical protein
MVPIDVFVPKNSYDLHTSFGAPAYELGDNRRSIVLLRTSENEKFSKFVPSDKGLHMITDSPVYSVMKRSEEYIGFRLITPITNDILRLGDVMRSVVIRKGEKFYYATSDWSRNTAEVKEIVCCTRKAFEKIAYLGDVAERDLGKIMDALMMQRT